MGLQLHSLWNYNLICILQVNKNNYSSSATLRPANDLCDLQKSSAFGQFLKGLPLSKQTCLPLRIPGPFTREDERPHPPLIFEMRQSTTQAAEEAGCLRRAEEVTVY